MAVNRVCYSTNCSYYHLIVITIQNYFLLVLINKTVLF